MTLPSLVKSFYILFKPQRGGSLPISRFFRKVFESKNLRLVLGVYLTVFTILIGFFSSPSVAFTAQEAVLARPKEEIHTETVFIKPVDGAISQGFHWYHQAIDIMADLDKPVYPIAKGVVREVELNAWGYGYKVVIDHENSFSSLYAHLGEIKVKAGDTVSKETVIAAIGLTGWTSGPHLHLEIWQDNLPIDPVSVLPEFDF